MRGLSGARPRARRSQGQCNWQRRLSLFKLSVLVSVGACLDASSFRLLPVSMGARSTRRSRTFPALFITRSREKTCVISRDIYRLHVGEAQQAWHRAKLHVEGVETSRQSDQLGNVIPPNTRSHEKTHAITHDIYRLHVEGAVRSAASCRAQPHTEGAPRAAATIRPARPRKP